MGGGVTGIPMKASRAVPLVADRLMGIRTFS